MAANMMFNNNHIALSSAGPRLNLGRVQLSRFESHVNLGATGLDRLSYKGQVQHTTEKVHLQVSIPQDSRHRLWLIAAGLGE